MCRSEYARLQRVLASIDETAVAIDLPPSFERTVWARLEPALQAGAARLGGVAAHIAGAAGARRRGRRAGRRRLLRGPGALAVGDAPPATAAATPAEQMRERILLTDVGEHLDRSQMALVELVSVGRRRERGYFGRTVAGRAAAGRQPAVSADRRRHRRRRAQPAARRDRAGVDRGGGDAGERVVAGSGRRAAPDRVARPAVQGPRGRLGDS